MPKPLRLFVASPLPPGIQQALAAFYRQRDTYASAIPCRIRWVSPEQWHITWLFLGNVAEEQLAKLEPAFLNALTAFHGGSLRLTDIRFWPSPHKPSLIICCAEPSPDLLGIPAALQAAFKMDSKSAKPFTPHITLARLKPVAIPSGQSPTLNPSTLPTFPSLSTAAEPLQRIGIYESKLTPAGAVYTERYRYALDSIQGQSS